MQPYENLVAEVSPNLHEKPLPVSPLPLLICAVEHFCQSLNYRHASHPLSRCRRIWRARLLLSRKENLNGRGFTPRRENSSAGFKTLPYKGNSARREACPPRNFGGLGSCRAEKVMPDRKIRHAGRRALREISEREVPAEPKILVPFTLEGACLSFRVRTSESPSRAGRCLKVSCLPS